jgi:hypothetical protein
LSKDGEHEKEEKSSLRPNQTKTEEGKERK